MGGGSWNAAFVSHPHAGVGFSEMPMPVTQWFSKTDLDGVNFLGLSLVSAPGVETHLLKSPRKGHTTNTY